MASYQGPLILQILKPKNDECPTCWGNHQIQARTACEAPWRGPSSRSKSCWLLHDLSLYDTHSFQCEHDKDDWEWLCNHRQTSPVWASASVCPCHTTWPAPSNPSPPLVRKMNNLEGWIKQSLPFCQACKASWLKGWSYLLICSVERHIRWLPSPF